MNVLITGGAGFIGTNLIKKLQKRKDIYLIRVIDDLSKGRLSYISKDVDFIKGNILNVSLALRYTKDIDVVIHLAAESGVPISIKNPMHSCEVNIEGTLNYLEASRLNNVKKFIFASSGGTILGNQEPPVTEESQIKPISPYGAGKAAGEHLCNSYYESFNLNTTIFRFSNVYGPYSFHKKGNFVPEFLNAFMDNKTFYIYGDGNQTRDFIYVDDLVSAIICAIDKDKSTGETFQLANSKETKIIDAVDCMNSILYKKYGKKVNVEYTNERNGDVKRNYAKIDKIKNYLNWCPIYSFEEGFFKMINNINI